MTTGPALVPTDTARARRSLERRNALMAAVWLVFLLFPVAGVATSDASAAARAAGMVGLAVFAALDILVIVRLGPPERWGTGDRVALAGICACCLVAIGLVPLLGSGVAGLLPYVVSLTSYALPLRWAWASLVATIAVAVGGPAVSGDLARWWPLTVVVLAVGVLSLGGRLVESRAQEVQEAREQARIADERDRMARDVHDLLGHSLSVIGMQAAGARAVLASDPDAADKVKELKKKAKDGDLSKAAGELGRGSTTDTAILSSLLSTGEGTVLERAQRVPRRRLADDALALGHHAEVLAHVGRADVRRQRVPGRLDRRRGDGVAGVLQLDLDARAARGERGRDGGDVDAVVGALVSDVHTCASAHLQASTALPCE